MQYISSLFDRPCIYSTIGRVLRSESWCHPHLVSVVRVFCSACLLQCLIQLWLVTYILTHLMIFWCLLWYSYPAVFSFLSFLALFCIEKSKMYLQVQNQSTRLGLFYFHLMYFGFSSTVLFSILLFCLDYSVPTSVVC